MKSGVWVVKVSVSGNVRSRHSRAQGLSFDVALVLLQRVDVFLKITQRMVSNAIEERSLEVFLARLSRSFSIIGQLMSCLGHKVLMASSNLLEGTLPNVVSLDLQALHLSGVAGHTRG